MQKQQEYEPPAVFSKMIAAGIIFMFIYQLLSPFNSATTVAFVLAGIYEYMRIVNSSGRIMFLTVISSMFCFGYVFSHTEVEVSRIIAAICLAVFLPENIGLLMALIIGTSKGTMSPSPTLEENVGTLSILELAYIEMDLDVPEDKTKAVEWLYGAADEGNTIAQFALGCMYFDGEDVYENKGLGVEYFHEAAERGNKDAQFLLGGFYNEGEHVYKNEIQATEWYRKAAEQGHADAQRNLGVMYALGKGIKKDEIQAVTWYRKAAEQGLAHAQCDLGYMYNTGKGVTKDKLEAIKWYRKAAEQGYANAQISLKLLE